MKTYITYRVLLALVTVVSNHLWWFKATPEILSSGIPSPAAAAWFALSLIGIGLTLVAAVIVVRGRF